eukprot:3418185-Rhodomonas_salina.3
MERDRVRRQMEGFRVGRVYVHWTMRGGNALKDGRTVDGRTDLSAPPSDVGSLVPRLAHPTHFEHVDRPRVRQQHPRAAQIRRVLSQPMADVSTAFCISRVFSKQDRRHCWESHCQNAGLQWRSVRENATFFVWVFWVVYSRTSPLSVVRTGDGATAGASALGPRTPMLFPLKSRTCGHARHGELSCVCCDDMRWAALFYALHTEFKREHQHAHESHPTRARSI